MDKSWKQTISAAKKNTQAIDFCNSQKLLDRFTEGVKLLDEVQYALRFGRSEVWALIIGDYQHGSLLIKCQILKNIKKY